jgi:phosphoribosylformylglycinamidine (FGAM) synthase-like enzyme
MVALAEMLLEKPRLGMDISLVVGAGKRLDTALYGESHGRILVSVNSGYEDSVLQEAKAVGIQARLLGEVTNEGRLHLKVEDRGVDLAWSVSELARTWDQSIEKRMARPGLVQT